MKRNRIILSLIACTLTLTGCDDQIMEWQKSGREYQQFGNTFGTE